MSAPGIILDEPDRLIAWAAKQFGLNFFSDARAIGWGTLDDIRAVAIYERWTGTDCSVHLVSDQRPGWLSRRFIAAGFTYPFVVGGLHRMTGLVPASNKRALRLNQHFGFRIEGALRRGANDGGDMIVMGMLREECPFIAKDMLHEQ
ncbi:GNAT family N-acetyltransferase [Sphingobium sp. IP1]|uniref:GNAT family N-acetyltransferase n=1 Tax=Sphingobium sp. IP1 TaxID=2021637 RepID=UPI00117B2D83|nr:GNAT family protein [Sphingobium sp. IP1]